MTQHAAFVEALRAVARGYEAVLRQHHDGCDWQELEVAIGNYNLDFSVVDVDFDNACEELQKIANDADIDRKMCGD